MSRSYPDTIDRRRLPERTSPAEPRGTDRAEAIKAIAHYIASRVAYGDLADVLTALADGDEHLRGGVVVEIARFLPDWAHDTTAEQIIADAAHDGRLRDTIVGIIACTRPT